ncbi:hypothetical protein SRHO_G00297520 [Serrasalmus rhombeus]
MESDRDQLSTGCRFPFFCLPRNKVIPHNNEEENLQQLQPESVSNMEKRQRKLEEGRRQQDCETQMSTRKFRITLAPPPAHLYKQQLAVGGKTELVPKKAGYSSVVWNWFGFAATDADQTSPRCKKIRKECKRDPGTEEMMTVKEIQDKKISDLMKILHQQKTEIQRCIEMDEALKRELKEKREMLSRKRMDYKKAKEREAEFRRDLNMMKERIAQQEQKREEERTYLEQIDYLHIFNVLTVLKCREQMDMKMQSEETLQHTEERAFIDGPSTSFLTEPTTSFNVSDSEESEEPGLEIQSFQEPEAEEPASETPNNTEEKCENSPRPEPSRCFSRFRFPKIRIPKFSFKIRLFTLPLC